VTTIHGFSSNASCPVFKRTTIAFTMSRSATPTAIGPALCGDDPPRYPAGGLSLRPHGSEDLLFFGRIHPDKGAAEAIAAARRTVGGWSWPASSRIRTIITSTSHPPLDNRSVSIAARWADARTKALGSARALLHLINFDEPFGLIGRGGARRGTPVIASNRGSMPELIDPGVTGFLVDSVMQPWMRSAVSAKSFHRLPVGSIHALHGRPHADRYLDLYRSLLG